MSVPRESVMDKREKSIDHLFENRSILLKYQHELRRSLDQAVLTLSSASLGLSLAFIRDMVPSGQPISWKSVLLVSWAAFTLCILLTLIGIWMRWKSMQWKEKVALVQYHGVWHGSAPEGVSLEDALIAPRERVYLFSLAAGYSQLASQAAFFAGIILTAVFVSVNLR